MTTYGASKYSDHDFTGLWSGGYTSLETLSAGYDNQQTKTLYGSYLELTVYCRSFYVGVLASPGTAQLHVQVDGGTIQDYDTQANAALVGYVALRWHSDDLGLDTHTIKIWGGDGAGEYILFDYLDVSEGYEPPQVWAWEIDRIMCWETDHEIGRYPSHALHAPYTTPVYDRTPSDIQNLTSKAYFNVADWERIYDNAKDANGLILENAGVKLDFAELDYPTTSTVPAVTFLNTLLENIETMRAWAETFFSITDTAFTEISYVWEEGFSASAPNYLNVNTWEYVLKVIYENIIDYNV